MRRIIYLVLFALTGTLYSQTNKINDIRFGDFTTTTGAIYGQMGYEYVKDAKADGSDNLYVLVQNYPRHYIIKYSSHGVILSTVTVSVNSSEDYNVLLGDNGNIYVMGSKAEPNNSFIYIKKYTDNLVFISSNILSASDIQFMLKSAEIDGSYIYFCVNYSTTNDYGAVISTISLSDLSFAQNPQSITDYSCHNQMVKKTGGIYAILKSMNEFYAIDVKSFPFSPIKFEGGLNESAFVHFASNSNNIFAVTEWGGVTRVYIYTSTCGFLSQKDFYSEGDFHAFASATDSSLLIAYPKFNFSSGNHDYYVAVITTYVPEGMQSFKLKNEFFANASEESSPKNIIVTGAAAYITGETNYCKSFGCDYDIRAVKFLNFEATTNKPPKLSFPPNFVYNGGIEQGRVILLNQQATFYVDYYDIDGDAPNYIKIKVKAPNKSDYTKYDMIPDCSGSCDYSQPVTFKYSAVFTEPGEYEYTFEAKDTSDNLATGYPTNKFYFNVIKGFEGSFSDADKTVRLSLPGNRTEKREYKIFAKGNDIYTLFNPNSGYYEDGTHRMYAPSFIAKLSTSPYNKNVFYDFNFNYPYMTDGMGWFIYDADFDENGNIQVVAAKEVTEGSYDVFFATIAPQIYTDSMTFTVVKSSVVATGLNKNELPLEMNLLIKYGRRIAWLDNIIVSCGEQCDIYEVKIDWEPIYIKSVDYDGNNLYFAGRVPINLTDISVYGKISGVSISTFTFKGIGNTQKGILNSIVVRGDYVFALGTFKTPSDNYGMILKFDKDMNIVDSKILNPRQYEEFNLIKNQGDYLLISGNLTTGEGGKVIVPFVARIDTKTLSYAEIIEENNNGISSELKDVYVDGSKIYYVSETIENLFAASVSDQQNDIITIAKYRMPVLDDKRVDVTVELKDKTGNGFKGVNVDFIPVEEGMIDSGGAIVGFKTDNDGKVNVKLLKNIHYFIAVTTHNYSPTTRQQFYDPYKRFVKIFSSPSTVAYTLSPSEKPQNIYTVTISSVVKGMDIFTSITYNDEIVSLSAVKATDSVITVNLYNLPSIEPNKYKLEVSVPDLLTYTAVITSTDILSVDFSSAVPSDTSYRKVEAEATPVLKGFVFDQSNNMPILGATIILSTVSGCNLISAVANTDLNGKFSLYLPNWLCEGVCQGCVSVKKAGYVNWNQSMVDIPRNWDQYYYLTPATYTISGYLTYNGIPLADVKIEAGGYNESSYNFSGTDSYIGRDMSWQSSYGITDSKGYFVITGLKDGNVALRVQYPYWRELNKGSDNQYKTYDDIRIVISSSTAIPPSDPPNNICKPGKVWILNSSGTCLGIAPYTFDIAQPITEDATLTLNIKYDEVGSTDTASTLMIEEDCHDNCEDRIMKMVSLPDNLTSGTTSYNVGLTKGKGYCQKVVSKKWAMRSFDECFELNNSTFTSNLILSRAGGLRIKVLKPDGSIFIPECKFEGCRWPRFYVSNFDGSIKKSADFWTDPNNPNPFFEIPNILPSRYRILFQAEGYPIAVVDDVMVEAGKITEVTLKMKEGLVVKPNITSLPESDYYYVVLSFPSGFEMKRKNINDLLFSESSGERYVIGYDSSTASFEQKFLTEGSYDFYLALASRFDPGQQSLRSFINFIGSEKGKVIKRNPLDPEYGTLSKPVSDFNIYGSIGKSALIGKIKGKKLISDKDFDKLFSMDLGYLISLIPSVMLYDEAGNLRAYSHCIMDSTEALNNFMDAITSHSTTTLLEIFNSSSSYFVPSLPLGRYTAVFLHPNYPPVTKDIVISSTYTVFDLDFDNETFKHSKFTVKVFEVKSGSTIPVTGARITLLHKAFETSVYTDDEGKYVFENIPLGQYKIEVAKDGYITEGKKFSLGVNEVNEEFILVPSSSVIKGKIYLSKFPKSLVSPGVEVVAYNETKITKGANYVPSIKVFTSENGSYEIKGVEKGSVYRIVAKYPGKLTQTMSVTVSTTTLYTYVDDIVFMDIPPQIDVKVKRYKNTLELYITSPKDISNIPECDYLRGRYTFNNFDETNATRLSLVKLSGNVYSGRFNISTLSDYYTIRVKVGDVDVIEKMIVYDVKNDISSENYIFDKIYLGGNIYADAENDDYTGIEIDPGSLTHSTFGVSLSAYNTNIKVAGVSDGLIGGFFKALPTVKTYRTSAGEMTVSDAIKSIMASDVYDINLENAQPNREFTLTLKYDKEKVGGNASSLKIYQYDDTTGQWKEIQGTYTVDPMLGTVSVGVVSISNAAESSGQNVLNPFIRKKLGMSAISGGKFVPQADSTSSQTGRFAVFIAKPTTGISYSGASFDIYNIPNPFNLRSKTVTISADGGSWHTGDYITEGTIIKYHLPQGKSGHIKLVIYNISGEKVRTLDEGLRDGGYIYYSEWDGRNDKNEKVASGVYFLVAYLNGEKIGNVHKMAVIK